MKLSNRIYDILKYVAMVGLPALGTLYFALSGIWGLPLGEEIKGTILAVNTALGAMLCISSANYSKEGKQ